MHCYTFMRHPNGTCISCQKWWTGPHCDAIVCNPEHGAPTKDLLMCECNEPATGAHCEVLTTADTLSHYNRRIAEAWVPVGALVIIPMIICFVLCERFADRRQIKRIERTLGDKMVVDDGSEIIHDFYP
uniref:EGF-like domain-containing protein n=1 Tax=Plectus sambesii TaxID=2011161 RepID=A0A914UHS0_9BILA